jgi:ribosomal protein S18 acetylase RimI-like enzyme
MRWAVMSEHEQVDIRRATETDLTAISHVLVDTWRTTFGGLVSDSFLDNMSYADQRDRHLRYVLNRRVSYWVAECGQTSAVIGFVSGGPVRDPEFPYTGELYAIYIRKEFQGRGIGTRLFCALVDQLLQSSLTSMMVWALGPNAHSFYERMGGRAMTTRRIELDAISAADMVAFVWSDLRFALRSCCQSR